MDRTKVALFDLDHVFISINSTFAFVEFCAPRIFGLGKYLRFLWMRLLYFVGSGWFMKEDKRDVWLRFLGGEEEAKVRTAAEAFSREKLSRTVDPAIAKYFSDLKGKGYRTVLVSASINPVVDAFAGALYFDDWFCGKLLVRGGRYTGGFEKDLRGEKENILPVLEKKYGALDLAGSYFFTDNQEDLPLAKRIGNSYGVVRGNFENLYWEKHGVKTMPASGGAGASPKRYLVPLTYFLLVRTASLTDKHLWFFYIGFPMVSLAVFGAFSLANVLWMFLSLAGFYSLYEIGYFVNDFVSVRREKKPTVRFDPNADFSHFWYVANRLIFFAAALALLIFFYPHQASIWFYVIANAATVVIFEVHNLLRGKWREITFPFLKIAHLFVPVVLFSQVDLAAVAAAIVLVYVPGHIFIYHRKVDGAEAPDRREMMRFVVLPACAVMAAFAALGAGGALPWSYFLLAAWLFVGHFIKILKLAYRASGTA